MGWSKSASTYREFVVKVTESKHAHKETLVGAERIHTDLLTHFEELVAEDRIPSDLLLVLDSKGFETGLELG